MKSLQTRFGLKESRFWHILVRIQRAIIIFCSLASVLMICAAVLMRYIFKIDFYGIEEIIVIVAFWLYFMGASHGSYEKSHIKADIVYNYVTNKRIKNIVGLTSSLIATFTTVIMTKWALDYFIWGIEKGARSPGWKIPLVASQSAIFFGLLLMAFYAVVYLADDIKKVMMDKD